MPHIRFLFIAPQLWVQLPSDPTYALAVSLAFGSANTWLSDFHLHSYVPCSAHTTKLIGRWSDGFGVTAGHSLQPPTALHHLDLHRKRAISQSRQ